MDDGDHPRGGGVEKVTHPFARRVQGSGNVPSIPDTNIRYRYQKKFVTLSSRREGPIDYCDLACFQLSLLVQRWRG